MESVYSERSWNNRNTTKRGEYDLTFQFAMSKRIRLNNEGWAQPMCAFLASENQAWSQLYKAQKEENQDLQLENVHLRDANVHLDTENTEMAQLLVSRNMTIAIMEGQVQTWKNRTRSYYSLAKQYKEEIHRCWKALQKIYQQQDRMGMIEEDIRF